MYYKVDTCVYTIKVTKLLLQKFGYKTVLNQKNFLNKFII